MGPILVLLGFGGKLLLTLLSVVGIFIDFALPYTIINLLSILCTLLIAGGFILQFANKQEPLNLIIAILVGISILPSFLNFLDAPFFSFIAAAYLLVWAFKVKEKNPLVAILLCGAFLWITLIQTLVFRMVAPSVLFDMDSPMFIIQRVINLGVTAIPVLAAFIDMNE